jgi:hypothetical protein
MEEVGDDAAAELLEWRRGGSVAENPADTPEIDGSTKREDLLEVARQAA